MSPPVQIQGSIFEENISWLWKTKMNADVALVAGHVAFFAHKFMLAVASSLFHSIFVDEAERIAILAPATSSSHSSLVSYYAVFQSMKDRFLNPIFKQSFVFNNGFQVFTKSKQYSCRK